MIDGYSRGEIPDYQMSAMTMAIYFRGMNRRETLDLTMAMMHSGETLDLSGVSGVKADKHSTGGVGDKTSLVLVPMVASLGVKMAKMSGRGLGHTGGTLDKLESIPGFNINLPMERFLENVDRVGMVIAGQTANLDPADKKLYALRDVTGTVASIPLIVSSIMSKKLAAGADIIVLDVKCGSGSFMKTLDDARELATEMVEIGKMAGRKTVAVITDMDEPLGHAVGNALEVKEAIAALRGEYKSELLELCLTLGSCILTQAGMAADDAAARAMLEQTITDGSALKKLAEFVAAQDGDPAAIYDSSLLPMAPVQMEVPSRRAAMCATSRRRTWASCPCALAAAARRRTASSTTASASSCARRWTSRSRQGSRSRRSMRPTRQPPAERSRSSPPATPSPRTRPGGAVYQGNHPLKTTKNSRSCGSGSFLCLDYGRRACADRSSMPSSPRH